MISEQRQHIAVKEEEVVNEKTIIERQRGDKQHIVSGVGDLALAVGGVQTNEAKLPGAGG